MIHDWLLLSDALRAGYRLERAGSFWSHPVVYPHLSEQKEEKKLSLKRPISPWVALKKTKMWSIIATV